MFPYILTLVLTHLWSLVTKMLHSGCQVDLFRPESKELGTTASVCITHSPDPILLRVMSIRQYVPVRPTPSLRREY